MKTEAWLIIVAAIALLALILAIASLQGVTVLHNQLAGGLN